MPVSPYREHVSRGGRRLLSPAGVFDRWDRLPYGLWVCRSGREVLFSRFYEPLLHRPAGTNVVVPAHPNEWVKDIETQSYFYDDSVSENMRRRQAQEGLVSWLLR